MIDLDARIAEGVARTLGHAAPFDAEELASIQHLEVEGVSDVQGLARFPGLRSLRVFASDLDDLGVLAGCSRLEELWVAVCPVRTLSGVERLLKLRRLHVRACLIADLDVLEPLSELEKLEEVVLDGNHLGVYRGGLPEAWEARRVPPLVHVGSGWMDAGGKRVARKFRHLTYLPERGGLLVRPGVARMAPVGAADVSRCSYNSISRHLEQPDDQAALALRWDKVCPDGSAVPRSVDDFFAHGPVPPGSRVAGAVAEQLGPRPAGPEQALRRVFLGRFRACPLMTRSAQEVAALVDTPRLAPWLTDFVEQLGNLGNTWGTRIRIGGLPAGHPMRPSQGATFQFGYYATVTSEPEPLRIDGRRVLVVGYEVDRLDPVLVVAPTSDDRRVWAFRFEDAVGGNVSSALLRPAFSSLDELLSYVVHLETAFGTLDGIEDAFEDERLT